MTDEIEIHHDDERGWLKLSCGSDAFAPYRAIAREQLADFAEIDVDAMMTIEIIDTERYVARIDARNNSVRGYLFNGIFVAVLLLPMIGFISIIRWLT